MLTKNTSLLSALWLMCERVIALGISFAVTLAVARHLMPEAFGRLSFLLALASLASPCMALGLNSLVTREVLQRPNAQHLIIGSSIVMRSLAGAVVAGLMLAVTSQYLPGEELVLIAVLLFSTIFNAFAVVDFWLQARMANRYAALLRLAVISVFSLARLLAVWFDAGLPVFIYLLAIEFVVQGLLYLVVYHRLGGGVQTLRISAEECRTLLRQSRWLLLSGIAAILYLKVDQIMLGVMLDDRAVGIYAAAARLSEVWYFVPAAIVTALFPHLIDKRATDTERYGLDVQKLNDLLFSLALLVALVMSVTVGWLLPAMFGKAYAESVPVLMVHIWAAILVFMRALLSKWLIAEELLRLSLLTQVCGAVANVGLNYYLIPLYGPLGAAYATVISYTVAGYGVLFFHRDLWPMAMVVTRSICLPYRLVRKGRGLYSS